MRQLEFHLKESVTNKGLHARNIFFVYLKYILKIRFNSGLVVVEAFHRQKVCNLISGDALGNFHVGYCRQLLFKVINQSK